MNATTDTSILIRRANDGDAIALRRLAQLDGARLPEGGLLVAEADGEVRAALRVADSAYVADPFYASKELVGLLDVRAKRLRRDEHSKVERTRTRLGVWSALYNRALQSHPTPGGPWEGGPRAPPPGRLERALQPRTAAAPDALGPRRRSRSAPPSRPCAARGRPCARRGRSAGRAARRRTASARRARPARG